MTQTSVGLLKILYHRTQRTVERRPVGRLAYRLFPVANNSIKELVKRLQWCSLHNYEVTNTSAAIWRTELKQDSWPDCRHGHSACSSVAVTFSLIYFNNNTSKIQRYLNTQNTHHRNELIYVFGILWEIQKSKVHLSRSKSATKFLHVKTQWKVLNIHSLAYLSVQE